MALDVHASFSAGELDPALHERTTLTKFQTGLATARNVYVARSGRIVTRAGRKHLFKTKLDNRKVKIYCYSDFDSIIEWGHQYARVYTINPNDPTDFTMNEFAHSILESDLDKVQFVEGKDPGQLYVFCFGYQIGVFELRGPVFGFTVALGAAGFGIPSAGTIVSNSAGGTGYDVDYAVSFVIGGQESQIVVNQTSKLPITTGTVNTIVARVPGGAAFATTITEMKVYRRPRNGGAYGYVGSSSSFVTTGADRDGTYTDIGSNADYQNSPPQLNLSVQLRGLSGPGALLSRTGVIYQQRLLISSYTGIESSRTGFPNNFYRDFPLAADSSLSFKAGSGGYAEVYFMIDSDGLNVFTSKGVFINTGALGPSNISLERKGSWVIDTAIPPLTVPGGVLFVDSTSNCIRRLTFSNEAGGYLGQELSIYSDHLFVGKKITSWAFEDGDSPLLWVTLSDGTFASFTFEPDQEMRAWTRHDTSNVTVEYVATKRRGFNQNFSFGQVAVRAYAAFVVNKNGKRYVEITVPRFVSAEIATSDPESDKNQSAAMMDSMKSYGYLINKDLVGADILLLVPVVAGVWNGSLTLTCGTSGFFPAGSGGAIGTIYRHFNALDGSTVDLTITARASDNSVTVIPSALFPSTQASNPRLYRTNSTYTGLDHLEGEQVSVMVDGYVMGSPNNDIEVYPTLTVLTGAITLPSGMRGAIVHVGRPITADAGTLDIDSVEQRPVMIESKTVDKLYVKSYRSRGIYVGPRFPKNNKVKGTLPEIPMQDIDSIIIDYEADAEIVGNRYQAPTTKRSEIMLPGDWKSNGRVCLRQVDPVHFEILSIIPDIDDERR